MQNYRSTSNILDAANNIIAHNEGRKDKKRWTETGEGAPITLFNAGDEREEAAWVCDRIRQMRKTGDRADAADMEQKTAFLQISC